MSDSESAPASTDPTWRNAREAVRLASRPTTLRKTLVIAAIVGTLLSVVNQGDVIVRGDADSIMWMRIAVNYMVPFVVSTAGFLSACRAPRGPAR